MKTQFCYLMKYDLKGHWRSLFLILWNCLVVFYRFWWKYKWMLTFLLVFVTCSCSVLSLIHNTICIPESFNMNISRHFFTTKWPLWIYNGTQIQKVILYWTPSFKRLNGFRYIYKINLIQKYIFICINSLHSRLDHIIDYSLLVETSCSLN